MTTWVGDNPFYVLIAGTIAHLDGEGINGNLIIDLDEPGWAKKYAAWMRVPGKWHLVAKGDNRVVLSVAVQPGDQPYYTSRVVGKMGSSGSNQTRAYGIGKKQANGEMVRLWIMANGVIVGGEDCDVFGIDIVVAEGPRQ